MQTKSDPDGMLELPKDIQQQSCVSSMWTQKEPNTQKKQGIFTDQSQLIICISEAQTGFEESHFLKVIMKSSTHS